MLGNQIPATVFLRHPAWNSIFGAKSVDMMITTVRVPHSHLKRNRNVVGNKPTFEYFLSLDFAKHI
jgi:hypothetical protein